MQTGPSDETWPVCCLLDSLGMAGGQVTGKKFSPSLSIDRGTQEDPSCAKMWPKALSPMEKKMDDLHKSSPKSQVSYPG